MNPTDCLEIVTLVQDHKISARIFELIEQNYGRNVIKEQVQCGPTSYFHQSESTM